MAFFVSQFKLCSFDWSHDYTVKQGADTEEGEAGEKMKAQYIYWNVRIY